MGAGLNKKAKERLNASKREGGTELNFSECDIQDFRNFGPVVAMKALVKLDLAKNQILELPPTIEQLKQLTVRASLALAPSSVRRTWISRAISSLSCARKSRPLSTSSAS